MLQTENYAIVIYSLGSTLNQNDYQIQKDQSRIPIGDQLVYEKSINKLVAKHLRFGWGLLLFGVFSGISLPKICLL